MELLNYGYMAIYTKLWKYKNTEELPTKKVHVKEKVVFISIKNQKGLVEKPTSRVE